MGEASQEKSLAQLLPQVVQGDVRALFLDCLVSGDVIDHYGGASGRYIARNMAFLHGILAGIHEITLLKSLEG